MNFGSVRSDRAKLFVWVGGLIFETKCIFEYKPSPHFRLDVVYKMGGVLTGHYGILAVYGSLWQPTGSLGQSRGGYRESREDYGEATAV